MVTRTSRALTLTSTRIPTSDDSEATVVCPHVEILGAQQIFEIAGRHVGDVAANPKFTSKNIHLIAVTNRGYSTRLETPTN